MRFDADPVRYGAGDVGAQHRVVIRQALGDVMEQRTQQQQLRSRAPCDLAIEASLVEKLRALGDGLEQVTINGESVIRVALRQGAHVRPLREECRHRADVIERFDDWKRAPTVA